MASFTQPSHLTNPLASSLQLETSATQLDGVPKDLEISIRFQSARWIQAAGMLLRLPQEIIAEAVTIVFRFWTGPDAGSMLDHDAKDVVAAALYLTTKPSADPVTVRQLLVVFEYLEALDLDSVSGSDFQQRRSEVEWSLTPGQYEAGRSRLYPIESHILRVLGFNTHVALPYTICINYLQALNVFASPDGFVVARQAFAHLNTALLSPQLLYLTHQPTALATAAIYLAAREVDVKLPEANWWEVFDVDREELGFIVVALKSVEGFASEERRTWAGRKIPLTVTELRAELDRHKENNNAILSSQ